MHRDLIARKEGDVGIAVACIVQPPPERGTTQVASTAQAPGHDRHQRQRMVGLASPPWWGRNSPSCPGSPPVEPQPPTSLSA